MSKEATKKFIDNNGFICNNCGKIIVDGTKHKNEEDLCDQCKIADLEAKLEQSQKERELDNAFWKQECDSLQKALAEIEKEIDKLYEENEDWSNANKVLKIKLKNIDQAKTDFAIEQLEKVKEFNKQQVFSSKPLENFVDQQIKELKEGK